MFKRRLFVALGIAGVVGATVLNPAAAQAASLTCIGTSFAGTLGTDQSICNGNHYVTMQTNGDLVLREGPSGRACYASGTRGANAAATFNQNIVGTPYVDIVSPSQGRIGRIMGAHRTPHLATNASVNSRGEFWIGYKKIGYC
ncbi:hypothetical protein H480_03036 [Amycolatopsis vancoresmycina DSM 44592]|uniref:Uncharacterized protein n=2 Tax=Amycolatopsis vancoresmycina TaxID=208444 RepID=R1II00_9PSEU|nr:hypothetical protein H480_03036 [Amycolatopsis vancoresmycina DSM 44592]